MGYKEDILAQLEKEFELGFEYKKGRYEDWNDTEDLYFGRVKQRLKGRFNVPLPIMSGFIDTLVSKIDEPPILNFIQGTEADYRGTIKTQAFYDKLKQAEDYDWDMMDLDGKKLNAFYGRAIYKAYGSRDKKFKFNVFNTDPYDFYADPMGGSDLENHRFCGENNIIKTRTQLEEGAKAGLYDTEEVERIVNNLTETPEKKVDNTEAVQANRYFALNLDPKQYNYIAEGALRCVESGTTYKGTRYYVLWSYEKKCILRCEPLTKVFKSNLWWWASWAANRDIFNFWSKAPADDIRPIAEVIRILANQELDNRQKQNWGMRAYDPALFPNGSELSFRPDGLVAVRAGASSVQAIQNGIFQFQTPQLNGTINLIDWLDNMGGTKTGITPASQGKAEEDKVGIYYGNMQQVADRLGLYNKSYVKCWKAIGRRFLWACKEHLTSAEAIKIIGQDGVEWDTIRSQDVNPGLDIMVSGGSAQLQADEIKKKRQMEMLMAIDANPNQAMKINVDWMIEQKLLNAGFAQEDIRQATDVENYGNRELFAKAAEVIDDIVKGKEPEMVRNANTAFLQKILDYAYDNTDTKPEIFAKLMKYIDLMTPTVIENKGRQMFWEQGQLASDVLPPVEGAPMPEQPEMTLPNTMEGTAARSQQLSQLTNVMASAT